MSIYASVLARSPCSISLKHIIGILMGIALTLYIALGNKDIVTIDSSVNMEYLFISLCLFQSLLKIPYSS